MIMYCNFYLRTIYQTCLEFRFLILQIIYMFAIGLFILLGTVLQQTYFQLGSVPKNLATLQNYIWSLFSKSKLYFFLPFHKMLSWNNPVINLLERRYLKLFEDLCHVFCSTLQVWLGTSVEHSGPHPSTNGSYLLITLHCRYMLVLYLYWISWNLSKEVYFSFLSILFDKQEQIYSRS